jgi:sugar/nucleoside kinase (ribokinase family)
MLPALLPRDAKPFDVVGLGQNSLDIVARVARHPEPDTSAPVAELLRLPGGEIATALVACTRLGCRTSYLGVLSRDPDGAQVAAALAKAGIDLSAVRYVDGPNRVAIILVDPAGRRTVLWHRPEGVQLHPEDVDRQAVTRGRILLVDAMDPDASAVAAGYARAAGIPTAIDIDAVRPGVDRLLGTIDVVIAAREFVTAYTGASSVDEGLARIAAESGASLSVATMGVEGSLAIHEGRLIRTPAFPVQAVDSTGAGDAFRGGFLAAWVRWGETRPVEALLEVASAVAALNCRRVGAQAGLPEWADVDVLVTRTTGVWSN